MVARVRDVEKAIAEALGASPTHLVSVLDDGFGGTARVTGIEIALRLRDSPGRHGRSPLLIQCSAVLALTDDDVVVDVRPREDAGAPAALLGVPDFDALFAAEIAPARIGQTILGPKTRARLIGFHPCRLRFAEGVLTLRVDHGSALDVSRLKDAVHVVHAIAERLPRALAAHDVEAEPVPATSDEAGYRGPSPEALVAADRDREAALDAARRAAATADRAEVATVLRRRRAIDLRVASLWLIALVVLIGLLVRTSCGHS